LTFPRFSGKMLPMVAGWDILWTLVLIVAPSVALGLVIGGWLGCR